MRPFILLILSANLPVNPVSADAQREAPPGYQQVWSDEFTIDGPPDPQKWSLERGFLRNKELQWYQPENAWCEDGKLIIEARRVHKRNPDYDPNSDDWRKNREFITYTSANLTTKETQTWRYGIFEIRARLQARAGLWPAIWFLGEQGRWPDRGEIDLMEYYDGMILANACWADARSTWKARWDSSKTPMASFEDPAWDQKFHIWKMEWTPQEIRLFVDDRLLNTIPLDKAINPPGREPNEPFQQPFFLLLNLAIGGSSGGDPSETTFPSRFEVDYVRVYQKIPSP